MDTEKETMVLEPHEHILVTLAAAHIVTCIAMSSDDSSLSNGTRVGIAASIQHGVREYIRTGRASADMAKAMSEILSIAAEELESRSASGRLEDDPAMASKLVASILVKVMSQTEPIRVIGVDGKAKPIDFSDPDKVVDIGGDFTPYPKG